MWDIAAEHQRHETASALLIYLLTVAGSYLRIEGDVLHAQHGQFAERLELPHQYVMSLPSGAIHLIELENMVPFEAACQRIDQGEVLSTGARISMATTRADRLYRPRGSLLERRRVAATTKSGALDRRDTGVVYTTYARHREKST